MTNRVKPIRQKQNLTQRELAKRAGTSQQQIQRIETGEIATRLELATSISAALGQPIDKVFPDLAQTVRNATQKVRNRGYLLEDAELEELEKTGVDADPLAWILKVLLRGHEEPMLFPIASSDKRRLRKILAKGECDSTPAPFLVFDSRDATIAINLSETTYCHLLFEPRFQPEPDGQELDSPMVVLLTGANRKLAFEVDFDESDPNEEDEMGQLANVLFYLELPSERHERIHFVDMNGEEVWLRIGDIALVQIPNSVLKPTDDTAPERMSAVSTSSSR